jgi:hypothetical protein
MAKVGNVEFYIKGELRRFELHYSQRDGFRAKDFPDEITRMAGTYSSGYATEGQLKDSLFKAIEKYHELISKERKIIAYSIMLPAEMKMNKTGEGSYSGYRPEVPKKLHYRLRDSPLGFYGFGFLIDYKVYAEIESNGLTYYKINSDGTKGYKDNNFDKNKNLVMDWSEEREAFFKGLHASTKAMVDKMLAFFGKEDDELLGLIDAGGQKLLGSGTE